MMSALKFGILAIAVVFGSANHLPAAVIIFSGIDPGVGPGGARPNADAAAAAFDLAAAGLGTVNLINFESAALGNFASLGIAPTVTATLSGTAADTNAGITDVAGDATLGYNTTSLGRQFLRFVPIFDIGTASIGLTFSDPVQAFGTYITGLGTANGNLSITFFDGSSQAIDVPGSVDGGVLFFGFTDAGASISSINLALSGVSGGSRDISSFDDIRFVASSVPEPGSLTLVGMGVLCLVAGAHRRRRSQKAAV